MARGTGGKIVNRQELADFLGISLPTVTAWVGQKMPYLQKGGQGREWQFDTAAVVQWKEDMAASAAGGELKTLEAIEKETARVKLEQEKLKYAKAAEMVVPVDQMERRLAIVFAEIRTNMRNIPGRVASIILGETNERTLKHVLLEEIDRALTGLSEFDTNTLDESLDSDAPEEPE
ncbi:terminase small subunit [Acetobacteraceae bacterium ESL0709]|nr:terminase small subunit [Acetobacteraceae bacterium ESL0697]MDF7677395.1 terminase small subunit [Acetobacteraceae bacterium ESL0709]